MKTKLAVIFLGLILMTTSACSTNSNKENEVGLANPASVYCEENGGKLEIMFDMGESYGICYFPNGSSCEERAYYRGECKPNLNNTGDQLEVIDFEGCIQAGYAIMESYPRQCKTPNGQTFIEKIKENIDQENIIVDEKDKENQETEKAPEDENLNEDIKVICTMDAKECPDGSFVSRVGPYCEFSPCPKTDNNNTIKDKEDVQEILEKCKPSEDGLNEDNIDCIEDIIGYFE